MASGHPVEVDTRTCCKTPSGFAWVENHGARTKYSIEICLAYLIYRLIVHRLSYTLFLLAVPSHI